MSRGIPGTRICGTRSGYAGGCHCERCRRANNGYNVALYAARRSSAWAAYPITKVPTAPLLTGLTRDRATRAWMLYRDVSEVSAKRNVDRLFSAVAFTVDSADRWCIALGTHLCLVYPELYATEEVA